MNIIKSHSLHNAQVYIMLLAVSYTSTLVFWSNAFLSQNSNRYPSLCRYVMITVPDTSVRRELVRRHLRHRNVFQRMVPLASAAGAQDSRDRRRVTEYVALAHSTPELPKRGLQGHLDDPMDLVVLALAVVHQLVALQDTTCFIC